MKKTYIAPTMQEVPVKMTQMLCASPGIVSNVDFDYEGETPEDFGSGDIR